MSFQLLTKLDWIGLLTHSRMTTFSYEAEETYCLEVRISRDARMQENGGPAGGTAFSDLCSYSFYVKLSICLTFL